MLNTVHEWSSRSWAFNIWYLTCDRYFMCDMLCKMPMKQAIWICERFEDIVSFKIEQNGQLNVRTLRLLRDSIVSGNLVDFGILRDGDLLAPVKCILCRQ